MIRAYCRCNSGHYFVGEYCPIDGWSSSVAKELVKATKRVIASGQAPALSRCTGQGRHLRRYWRETETRTKMVGGQGMHWQQQWWSGLVAAVLGGLLGVTAVAAAGAQFLPVLSIREGALRFDQIPQANGYIDYLTLLNVRDGGINGVPLVWEECETVYDVTRGIECYERLKAKGPTGAAAFQMANTP